MTTLRGFIRNAERAVVREADEWLQGQGITDPETRDAIRQGKRQQAQRLFRVTFGDPLPSLGENPKETAAASDRSVQAVHLRSFGMAKAHYPERYQERDHALYHAPADSMRFEYLFGDTLLRLRVKAAAVAAAALKNPTPAAMFAAGAFLKARQIVAAHAKPRFSGHLAEAYPAFRSRCCTSGGNGNEIFFQ